MDRLLGWWRSRREARRERKLGELLRYADERQAELDAELEAYEFPREVRDQLLVLRCPCCGGDVHEFQPPGSYTDGFISWLQLDPEPGRVYGAICGGCGSSFELLHRAARPAPRS